MHYFGIILGVLYTENDNLLGDWFLLVFVKVGYKGRKSYLHKSVLFWWNSKVSLYILYVFDYIGGSMFWVTSKLEYYTMELN